MQQQSAQLKSADYWLQAKLPLNCLLFLAPLLVVYELGVIWLGGSRSDELRNGADHWMRGWLRQTGCERTLWLPLFVVAGLLAWQHVGKYRWKASPDALLGMFAESLLFAFCLVAIGQLQDLAFRHCQMVTTIAVEDCEITASNISFSTWQQIVNYVGAGVYEEVLFRLCLLPLCYGAWRLLQLPRKPAMILAVVLTSVLFSVAHYIGPAADVFSMFSFTFRVLAGMFFAILLVSRGFGITVGSHVAYDLLVGIILATHGSPAAS